MLINLFGCLRSELQHMGSLLCHGGVFHSGAQALLFWLTDCLAVACGLSKLWYGPIALQHMGS